MAQLASNLIAGDDFDFLIFLPLPPKYGVHRHVPLGLAYVDSFDLGNSPVGLIMCGILVTCYSVRSCHGNLA